MCRGAGVAISVGAATMIAATDDFEACVRDPDGWMKEGGYLGGERWNSGAAPQQPRTWHATA